MCNLINIGVETPSSHRMLISRQDDQYTRGSVKDATSRGSGAGEVFHGYILWAICGCQLRHRVVAMASTVNIMRNELSRLPMLFSRALVQ